MTDAPRRTEFNDVELRAYLDGDADEALRADIDAVIERDDAMLERIAALDDVGDLVRPAFDQLLETAPREKAASSSKNDGGAWSGRRK